MINDLMEWFAAFGWIPLVAFVVCGALVYYLG